MRYHNLIWDFDGTLFDSYLLENYGIPAEDCVMIGDREIDVGSGCAAGIRGILFDEFHSLGETSAQHRIFSVAELRELLLDADWRTCRS